MNVTEACVERKKACEERKRGLRVAQKRPVGRVKKACGWRKEA